MESKRNFPSRWLRKFCCTKTVHKSRYVSFKGNKEKEKFYYGVMKSFYFFRQIIFLRLLNVLWICIGKLIIITQIISFNFDDFSISSPSVILTNKWSITYLVKIKSNFILLDSITSYYLLAIFVLFFIL